MLRKMDILQEVLSRAHARSLEKYSDIDQEDDFCEVAEAPEIQCECFMCFNINTQDSQDNLCCSCSLCRFIYLKDESLLSEFRSVF